MLLRHIGILLVLCVLSACRLGQPSKMAMSFSAYTDRPVVVTEMLVNGTAMQMMPTVARGKADDYGRALIMGNRLLGYPKGTPGVMNLKLTWVELPHGAAYQADVDVSLSDLTYSRSSGIDFSPIFAPGGLLIIASDPLPKKGAEREIRDVVRMCGTRMPALDVNYVATPRELPGLYEALQAALTTPAASEC